MDRKPKLTGHPEHAVGGDGASELWDLVTELEVRETELANPIFEWLESRGYTPYSEIAWGGTAIDIVGLSDKAVWAVELKLCLSWKVIRQAHRNQLTAHKSWCAVGTRPRNFEQRNLHGLGLLSVVGGRVEVVIEAEETPDITNATRLRQLRGACAYREPRGIAGLPTMKGVGPAQKVFDAVERFKAANPSASWAQVFANVPSHYAHARSMQGAMRTVRDIRLAQLVVGAISPPVQFRPASGFFRKGE